MVSAGAAGAIAALTNRRSGSSGPTNYKNKTPRSREPEDDRRKLPSSCPEGVCPVLFAYCRGIDAHSPSRKLYRQIARLAGTRSNPDVEVQRALFFINAGVHTFVPWALEAIGLTEDAIMLRSLPVATNFDEAEKLADFVWVAARSSAAGDSEKHGHVHRAAAATVDAARPATDWSTSNTARALSIGLAVGWTSKITAAQALDTAYDILNQAMNVH